MCRLLFSGCYAIFTLQSQSYGFFSLSLIPLSWFPLFFRSHVFLSTWDFYFNFLKSSHLCRYMLALDCVARPTRVKMPGWISLSQNLNKKTTLWHIHTPLSFLFPKTLTYFILALPLLCPSPRFFSLPFVPFLHSGIHSAIQNCKQSL